MIFPVPQPSEAQLAASLPYGSILTLAALDYRYIKAPTGTQVQFAAHADGRFLCSLPGSSATFKVGFFDILEARTPEGDRVLYRRAKQRM